MKSVCAGLMIGWSVMTSLSACELYLWDGKAICDAVDAVAESPPGLGLNPAYEQLIREAEVALGRGPFSVTHKTKLPPSGDFHDFCTLSPYFWPVSWLPAGTPYVFCDGKVKPEAKSDAYDRERYFEFMRTVVFRQAAERYPDIYFSQAQVYLDDLDATHRLRLLHDRAKTPDVLASVTVR